MADENEPNPSEVTPPAQDTKETTDNMLKVLGYYTDPKEQEKVPKPEAGETETEQVETETEASTKEPAETETETASEDTEVKPGAPVIPKDQRAAKLKPSDVLDKPPTKEEIANAVKDALSESKTPAAVDPLAKYGELGPQEKRALELAQFAAKHDPVKYKDMEAREINWISKNREYIQKVIEEKGSFTQEDANSEEYQTHVRRYKPTYQPGDKEDLLIERGVQKGLTSAESRFNEELAKRDREIASMRITPQIEKVMSTIEADILSVLDKPIADAIKADPSKAISEYGHEAPLAVAIITDTQHNAREYLALANKVREYDKNDPVHVKLVSFIRKQGEFLENIPEASRQREGKVLVSRERWAGIPKDQRNRYATFSDGDILDMIAVGGRNYLTASVKTVRAQFDKLAAQSGYVKKEGAAKPATEAAKPAVEKTPAAVVAPPAKPVSKLAQQNPPKGGSTASPGTTAAPKVPIEKQVNAALSALGYDNLPTS